ncbi:bifunctional phosphopantothenoylcysteine decarboxylase/phosphopantothenate--cysteine ligase CoaBC [bacterium]|nr:MAG: bifunctional phosphopantothenoylcysteine decarboxylase/phosphopantothenate--cysteine ligase CoaBC [bacterium]
MMNGKTIVLGVGGGIAAYKVADLASKLTQRGADVHAVLTESATRFIAPLTFTALTHNPAQVELWAQHTEAGKAAGMPHIALADKADLIVIAPASADLIARLAGGFADDLLTTLVTATRAPIAFAPAMNPTMLGRPATQRNIAQLLADGFHLIQPDEGRMACEHVGSGRLPETPELIAQIEKLLFPVRDLEGKRVVITAGPTRENLDPVRFISNRSSGKMGYALAEEARNRGAFVTLVSGPTALATPQGVERIDVQSALEMRDATVAAFEKSDVLIACAAPADFRAASQASQKIKRGDSLTMQLELVANPDIVRECGTRKLPGQIVVGFAAETQNLEVEALRKMQEKNLDAIIANDVTRAGAGFDSDTNAATFYSRENNVEWPLIAKTALAAKIWNEIVKLAE